MKGSDRSVNQRRRAAHVLPVLLCALALIWIGSAAPPADAAGFGLTAFDGQVSDATGDPFTPAGGHAHTAWTAFELAAAMDPTRGLVPNEAVRKVSVILPPGLVGNPAIVPECPGIRQLLSPDVGTRCPVASQVGVADVKFGAIAFPAQVSVPVYSMTPPESSPAAFGFQVAGFPVLLTAKIRSEGDYGVTIVATGISQGLALLGTKVTLWGVPADPVHDNDRGFHATSGTLCSSTTDPTCTNSAGLTPRAFITNPTSCTAAGTGLETTLLATSWSQPASTASASFVSHAPPAYPAPPEMWGPPLGPDGCDNVPFSPTLSAQPTENRPDAPTGLDVELAFPQDGLENPTGIATGHLKRATVTLPEGMTISPSAAHGLAACSDAEIGIGTAAAPTCPAASKIGVVEAVTPLLDEPVTGSVYVGSQRSGDPESGEMFRLFLVLRNDERGILVKLTGAVRADGDTGRLETTFDNNPQLPVSSIRFRFKGGPTAPLATPATCGPKTTTAELTSWSGAAVVVTDEFSIACPGVSEFKPSMSAGTLNPAAGAFSPFALRIDRNDREGYVNGVSLELPPGLVAKLRDVPLCPDAQAAAGTCGAESRVGTATVAAGPGSDPFFLQGSVSLTGPYKGAPYGLSVAVRVVAGPFDLGTVVVRQAIFVDPIDAHITVVSDPLPVILKGVPVRLRSIGVDVNRPGFTVNPTSCAAKEIKGTFGSPSGATAQLTQQFRAGGCRALALKPRLRLRLLGRKQVKVGRHPGVRAVLTQREGEANLEQVSVRLPLSLALDPDNAASDSLCSFEEGTKADPQCPESSLIGHARAVTPLLNRPLTGPVYFTRNQRIHPKTGNVIRTLPMLVIPLRGEVAINLKGTSSVSRGRLVNTFAAVPDTAVSRFTLRLKGGKRGILTTVRNTCRGKQIARLDIDGQNGKRADRNIRIKAPCAKKGKGKRAGARKGAPRRRAAARAIARSGRGG